MTFELVEQSGKISSLFSITSKDYVETLQNLNYEDSPKQYQLNIIATEVETGLKSTAEVIRQNKFFLRVGHNHKTRWPWGYLFCWVDQWLYVESGSSPALLWCAGFQTVRP